MKKKKLMSTRKKVKVVETGKRNNIAIAVLVNTNLTT